MAKRKPLAPEQKALGARFNFSQEQADKVCELIATSEVGIHKLLKDNDLPSWKVIDEWLHLYPSFVSQYARAREAQADYLAGRILEISDDSSNDTIMTEDGPVQNHEWVNRSRLRVDARKWMASKLAPKVYGEKIDLTTKGNELKQTTVIVKDEQTKRDLDTL